MSRSVSRPRVSKPAPDVGVIGYIVAAAALFILLPLLPFLVLFWIVQKFRGKSANVPLSKNFGVHR